MCKLLLPTVCLLTLAALAGCSNGAASTATTTTVSTQSPATATLSGTTISFQNTALGKTSVAQSVTLTNSGQQTLSISSVTLGGANPTVFTLANGCEATLAAGANCTIGATFTPQYVATFAATISVTTSAGTAAQTITLTGNSSSTVTSQCTTAIPRKAGPSTTTNYAGLAFSGKVMAGSLPMIGASVQLYAAGAAGNGSAPTAIGSPIVTGSTGAFSVAAAYACPYNLSTLYLVATGGKAGANGATTAGAVLMSVLGPCNSISANASFVVNEATTVAGAYALQQFLAVGGKVGASSTNFLGLQLAAATAANLVNPATGTSPGATFPATGTPPSAFINTLSDVLNACLTGASSSGCSQLYAATTPASASAPTNTLDALLNLARNPALGSGLYTASQASTAYAPGLTAAPGDWSMFVSYGGAGMNAPSSVGVDSGGNIWVASYFGAASYFNNAGTPVFPSGISGDYLNEGYGLAVDLTDAAWVTDEQSSYGVNSGNGLITVLATSGTPTYYTTGGINFPVSVAIDSGGAGWIVDYGNSHLTLLDASGNPLSGTDGYTNSQFIFPVAVAVDANCYGYVANQSSNTVTRVARDGSNFTSYTTGYGPAGVAVDAGNNIWVTNYFSNTVGLVAANGTVLSSSLAGGGINHPQGVAIDGNGNAWVTNFRGGSLSEFAAVSSASPGAVLSPSAGFAPDAQLLEAFGIAIDPSGNLWVTGFGNNLLTEVIGMAAPVKTPMIGPPVQP